MKSSLQKIIQNERLLLGLFGLAALSDFYLSYIQIGPFPLRNYVCSLVSLIALVHLFSNENVVKNAHKYLPVLIFPALVIYSSTVDSFFGREEELKGYIKHAIKFPVILITSIYLSYYFSYKKILQILLALTTFNALIAFLQGLNVEWAWAMREFIDIKTMDYARVRPSGLSYFATLTAEQLMLGSLIGIFFFTKDKKPIYLLSIIIFLASTFISATRSVLLVILVCAPYLVLNSTKDKTLIKRIFIFMGLFFTGVMVFASLVSDQNYLSRMATIDGSIGARIYNNAGAIKLLMKNFWFGLGADMENFRELVTPLIPAQGTLQGHGLAHRITPHNYTLIHLLKYGLFGLITLAYYYYEIFLKVLRKANVHNYTALNISFIVAITLNSCFHNGGVLNSSTYTLFIGLVLGTTAKGSLIQTKSL